MTTFGLHGEFVLYIGAVLKIKLIQTKAIHFITKEFFFYYYTVILLILNNYYLEVYISVFVFIIVLSHLKSKKNFLLFLLLKC